MSACYIICWVLTSFFGAWLLLRLIPAGLDSKRPFTELIALCPYVGVIEIFLTICSYGTGNWGCGILGSIFILWQIWFMRSYIFGKRRKAPLPLLTVMTVNCRYGKADVKEIENFAKKEGVDVLGLQEVSPSLKEKVSRFTLFPYQVSGKETEEDNGGFNMILSRKEPLSSVVSSIDLSAAQCPAIKLDFEGKVLLMASVHPKSPHRGGKYWGWGVNHLASFLCFLGREVTMPKHCPKLRLKEPDVKKEADCVVVMGDMNSSLDLPSFRAVLKSGMKDSSMETHTGPHPTFPAGWKGWHQSLELDHILHSSGLRSYFVKTKKIPGTDHLALISRLAKEEDAGTIL